MKNRFPFLSLFAKWLFCILIIAMADSGHLSAQLPAFPGAEGYGKYATGGRGTPQSPTTVFEVTNLSDNNTQGSLRYALSAPATYRTVVFRVGGTIRLLSPLNIPANTTIAGQTAPGGGICVADHPVAIKGDNVIIRYMRFRMGDRYQNLGKVDGSGNGDALGNLGNKKIIIDHCSISWSSDEALTVYRGDSITLQWNIISEPLNYSYHFEAGGSDYQEHGYGGIWGSRNGSFHHNLIMHVKGRAPRFAGNSSYPAGTVEKCDFRNNVIYNWRDYSTNGGEGGNYNVVNNYYKYGPSTSTGSTSGVPKRGMIMNPSKSSSLPYPKIYLEGNFVDGYADITAANWRGMAMADGGTQADTMLSKVNAPFSAESITTHTALEAYNLVLVNAGANLPQRDTLDERLIRDVTNRSGRIIDVQGGFPHGTPFEQTLHAWPALATGAAPVDTDKDGMPDSWETANGLDPNNPADRAGSAANGYTHLENYLNSLTSPKVVPTVNAVVALDGSGDFTSVQAAINAAPTGLTAPYIIFIKNGKYREKITIPSNKPFIHLVGESVANTILYYDDGASDVLPGGGTIGTQGSASVTVNATDFAAFNITFANTYGNGTQAVAIVVNNDRAVFRNCRFLGNQDTLYLKGSGTPKHYFKDCYIDGNVDFIFGSAVALFDSCVIYAKTRANTSSSYLGAPNTPPGQAHGFVFRDCDIPDNPGGTTYFLARPWQNTASSSPIANNKMVLLNTRMGNTIKPEGWSVWDATTNTSLIYFGEYNSKQFDGMPVNTTQRVPWSFQLTQEQAAAYTKETLFGSWDPCAVHPEACATTPRDIAISNFRATKGAASSLFEWNISWAMEQIRYELFRASQQNGTYEKVGEVTAPDAIGVNFQLMDALPAAGTSFFYYLKGSKDGLTPHITDTLEISSVPTINTSGVLQQFVQNLGTPSAPQQVTLSAENLLGGVTIATAAPFEISVDTGKTWVNHTAPITLDSAAGKLAPRTLSIRLNAAGIGEYADSIALSTPGGKTVFLNVSGTTQEAGTNTTGTLLHWPFTTNGQDSAEVRSPGVLPSESALFNLYLSNGTTVAAIPAYSERFGQAFGASANGDGTWSTSAGGPGGTLRRNFYEEFTVTAKEGYRVRVDSMYVTGAFYNTSSNTRLGVVYSRSGFAADSTDVLTIPGGFANPIALPNQTGGPTATFALSVAGPDGITLQPGETLTFRFYFSCSSSSAGRYAMLKNVRIAGEAKEAGVTSTGELLIREQFKLFPNPAGEVLTLEYPESNAPATLSVWNSQGVRIGQWLCPPYSRQAVLPLPPVPAGLYFLLYQSAEGRITLPFVKY